MFDSLAQIVFVLVAVLTAAIYMVLAVISLRRGPVASYTRYWVAFCLVGTAHILSIAAANYADTPTAAEILIRTSMGLSCGVLSLLLVFSLAFVGKVRDRLGLAITCLGLGATVLVLLATTDLIVAGVTTSEFSRYAPVAGPLAPFFLAFVIFTWLAPITVLFITFRRSTGRSRSQLAYVLLAFGFGLLGTSGYLLPAVFRSQTLLAFLPAVVLPLFPLTITYAIVRHRLWGIRTILHRTAAWTSLILLLVLPLTLTIWVGAGLFPNLSHAESAFGLTALFLLGFLYLRAAKSKLDHLFQRRDYNRHRVQERFSRDMAAVRMLEEVAWHFLETVSLTLYPRQGELRVRTGAGRWKCFYWSENDIRDVKEETLSEDSDVQDLRLIEYGEALDLGQLHNLHIPEEERRGRIERFEAAKAQVCVPLSQGGEPVGLLFLGENVSLRSYTREDLEFLEQLGASASIGLSNAMLFDEVDAQRRDLADLSASLEMRVHNRTAALEESNQKLTQTYDKLRNLEQMKSRFFANISHELRTPLSLILAPMQSMLSGGLGDLSHSQKQQLEGIQRNALQLLKQIDDLLDLSKLEESGLKLRIEKLDLAALVAQIADTAKPLAVRKRIEIETLFDQRPEIEVDPGKLERVLINLLSNALKFTDPGGRVKLTIGRKGSEAWVKVEDDGVGIPADQIEHIFDRFHQVDSSHTRRFGGTGIGLSLAKELVELHGGRIEVESEPGLGSTFLVFVPVDASELPDDLVERRHHAVPPQEKRREDDQGIGEWSDQIRMSLEYRFLDVDQVTDRRIVKRRSETDGKSARILVVDDNTSILKYLDQLLGERYDVWHAQDGERALELLIAQRHDLVISDVMMPNMSGFELCRRIKDNPRLNDTPVILLTAKGGEKSRIEGHYVGADQYITKPFSPAELDAAVEAQLSSRVRRTETAAHRRSASLETLLAGLAHELRNACHQAQTSQIAGWKVARDLAGMNADGEFDERLRKMEAISQRALGRIGAVVVSLQQYAFKNLKIPWTEHDLDELVGKEVGRLTSADEKNVQIELALHSGITIRGPHEELRQMILNLVENAVQAVAPGGWVRVETESNSGRARLSVLDDGPGVAPEDREMIFDLFFTKKAPGEGIGLGLALVHRTVTDLGGTIRVDKIPGRGAKFTVELPCDPKRATLVSKKVSVE